MTVQPGDAVLDRAACGRGVVPAFQPIVTLDGGATVGFEALARWPDLRRVSTGTVFQHADELGSRSELNEKCATAALWAALRSDLPAKTLLTVNYEPDSAYPGALDDRLLARARDQLTVAFELTERGMLAHPHRLLATVAAMRADGFLIALDDVGAHPDSLAVLDVLEPDIIKLDMALVQRQPDPERARTITAVLAHHERTGTLIIAEGIENDAHVEHAVALGASMGQGFKYGPAGPIASAQPAPVPARTLVPSRRRAVPVPFALAEQRSAAHRVGPKRILMALSEHIEAQATCTVDPPIVLTALQQARYFTREISQRYGELAQFCPLVAVFGQQLPARLGDGVRGVALDSGDPLCTEWTVVALGPQLAVALIARERPTPDGHTADEGARQFDFILTFERQLVTAAAHSLLQRMF